MSKCGRVPLGEAYAHLRILRSQLPVVVALAAAVIATWPGAALAQRRTFGPSPSARLTFEGLHRSELAPAGNDTALSNPSVAAGGNVVLQATNSALRLTDRRGRGAETVSLNGFFGIVAPRIHGAQAYFDRMRSRFYIAALSHDRDARTSTLHFAVSPFVSERVDPTLSGRWCRFEFDARTADAFAGSLTMGANEFWVAIAVDELRFRNGRRRSASVYVVDKQDFGSTRGDGACISPDTFKFPLGRSTDRLPPAAVRPAVHYTSSALPGRPLFMINSQPEGMSNAYTLWQITGAPGQRPVLRRFDLGGDRYTKPPDASQRNGPDLDTGDARITAAAFRNGRLWAVQATGCKLRKPPANSCIRVVEIVVGEGQGPVVASHHTIGRPGWFLWRPGLAVNLHGDLLVPYYRSQRRRSPGVAYSGRNADDDAFDRWRGLVDGTCAIDDLADEGREFASGAIVAQSDPDDQRGFWISGEYAGDVPGLGCGWRTRVGLVRGRLPQSGPPILVGGGQIAVAGGDRRARHSATVDVAGVPGSAGRVLVVSLRGGAERTDSLDYPFLGDEASFANQIVVPLASGPRTLHLSLSRDLAAGHEPAPG